MKHHKFASKSYNLSHVKPLEKTDNIMLLTIHFFSCFHKNLVMSLDDTVEVGER